MHEAVQTYDGAANTFEVFNFQTEITNRDKDHVSLGFGIIWASEYDNFYKH